MWKKIFPSGSGSQAQTSRTVKDFNIDHFLAEIDDGVQVSITDLYLSSDYLCVYIYYIIYPPFVHYSSNHHPMFAI